MFTYCSPTKTPRDAGMDPPNAFAERSSSLQPTAHSEAMHIHTATHLGNGYIDRKQQQQEQQQQQQQQQHSRQSGQLAHAIRDRACEVVRPEVHGPASHNYRPVGFRTQGHAIVAGFTKYCHTEAPSVSAPTLVVYPASRCRPTQALCQRHADVASMTAGRQ